jgi:hypothetical protein
MLRGQGKGVRLGGLLLPCLVFSSLVGCFGSALDPRLPDGTIRFTPPPVYQVWWSLTEECSGRSGSVSSVEWFVVPGVSEFEHEGRTVSGYWSRVSNRVVLAEKAMMDGSLVRHEMLHALEHDIGHPRQAFLQRCGGVVVCITSCLRDAGSAPVPGARLARLPPDSMAIDVQVNPQQPGYATDEGHFRLTVTVRNPRRDSVVVLLPASGDGAPPSSFSFVLKSAVLGLWYGERAWDAGIMVFGPGETRRAIYDFTVASRFDGLRALPPGEYGVRGGFGPALSASRSFVLAQ